MQLYRKPDRVDRNVLSLWRYFFERRIWLQLIALCAGTLLATADLLQTSRHVDNLLPREARIALRANQTILDAVLAPRKDSNEVNELNQKLIEKQAEYIDNEFQAKSSMTFDEICERAAKALKSDESDIQDFEPLLDATVYLQIVFDPVRHPVPEIYSLPYYGSQFIELLGVIYAGAMITYGAVLLATLRLRVFRQGSPPPLLVDLTYCLLWAVLVIALWPPLRIYTIQELSIIYPQSSSLAAPIGVLIFCIGVTIMLMIANLSEELLQIATVLLGLAFSIAAFFLSLNYISIFREFVGSKAQTGNLLMFLVISLAVLITFGFLLLYGLSPANGETSSSPENNQPPNQDEPQ
jgi:hypothetical protein